MILGRRAVAVPEERAGCLNFFGRRNCNRCGSRVTESMRIDCCAKDLAREICHSNVDAVIGHWSVASGDPETIRLAALEERWSHLIQIILDVRVKEWRDRHGDRPRRLRFI